MSDGNKNDIHDRSEIAFNSWLDNHRKYHDILTISYFFILLMIPSAHISVWQPILLFIVGVASVKRLQRFFLMREAKGVLLNSDRAKTQKKYRDAVLRENPWKGFSPVASIFLFSTSLCNAMVGILILEWILYLINNFW